MQEQINLFQVEESYSLVNLKQSCYEYVKRKYTRTECEDFADFMEFIRSEAELEFAIRLRKIADDIEKRELGKR